MSENFIPGGKWKIYANGFMGDLEVEFVGGNRFVGKVFGDVISGVWQEGTVKFSFTRAGSTGQIYHGYLAFPARGGAISAVYTLAGTFDDVNGTYGWFAQQSVIV